VDTAEKTRALSDTLALNPLDAKGLIKTFGLFGIWIILFAETGLMVGFFLPGDSLLFLAGIAASPVADEIIGAGSRMSLTGLLIGAPICAVAGAQLGHWLGARYGRRLFDRPNSRLFKREYVEKAEFYFKKYGPAKAVVLARFIPIVRTFLNPVAGVLGMPARQFLVWNVIGGVLWTDGVILAGWALARKITDWMSPEDIDHYILPVTALIVLISILPILIEIVRTQLERRRAGTAGVGGRHAAGPGEAPKAESRQPEA
jgi:membrane-associated protein